MNFSGKSTFSIDCPLFHVSRLRVPESENTHRQLLIFHIRLVQDDQTPFTPPGEFVRTILNSPLEIIDESRLHLDSLIIFQRSLNCVIYH